MSTIDGCRICGYAPLHDVLDLGETPLANALLATPQAPEETYPLKLVFCPQCTLVQITETVAPEILFRDYLYFSSFSDTLLEHARTLSAAMIERWELNADSLVVEIASNDGYLLQYYQGAGVPVLGVEPARNIAEVAQNERNIPTIPEFFNLALAESLIADGRRADLIHAHNVLAHVSELRSVVAGFAALLQPEGVVVVEAPYIKPLIDHREFDTIYHEHLCYFSLTALDHLFSDHGLTIFDVEQLPIHGGSLRIFAGHHHPRQASVTQLLAEERAWGVGDLRFYADFAEKVEALKAELLAVLHERKAQGRRIAAYGASAKGSTLLNYFGIGAETLDFVVDRSTYKQGRYTPGGHLPILPPEALLEQPVDDVLLLVWNFVDEILAQQAAFRQKGGQFIVPIPELRIV